MSLEVSKWLLSLIVMPFGLIIPILKIREYGWSKSKNAHEIYQKIRTLIEDSIDKNHAEIVVLFNAITKRNLSKKEMHWFITQPHAFGYVSDYGQSGAKFVKINLDENRFELTSRYSNLKKRMVFMLGMFASLLIYVFTVSAIAAYSISISESANATSITRAYVFLIMLLGLVAFFIILSCLDKAVKLSHIQFQREGSTSPVPEN